MVVVALGKNLLFKSVLAHCVEALTRRLDLAGHPLLFHQILFRYVFILEKNSDTIFFQKVSPFYFLDENGNYVPLLFLLLKFAVSAILHS